MKFIKYFLLLWISANSALAQNAPAVAVSINPLYQILLAITNDKDNSHLIINPSTSEHNYQLKKSDVEFLSKADLVFYIDRNLEKNFPKLIKNSAISQKSYELSQVNGIKLIARRNNSKIIDSHIWLNPQNAVIIAEFMTQKISEIDPKNSQKYQINFIKFKKEVEKTEKIIRQELAKNSNSNYVFYHDGYQYFEDYFATKPLKIMSYDHATELSVKDVREFDLLANAGKVKCIFGEALDEKNSAQKLAQNYKIKFATLDVIGRKEDGGYSKLLLRISKNLKDCSI
jgi:zinc transport system substrate-binding protein